MIGGREEVGDRMEEMKVCGRPLENFLEAVENFHGYRAPGVVLGGFMVDLAQELVGPEVESDAMVETIHCLPDAVQILTPCTMGNGWLKVLDWDKFALTLYNRRTLNGYKVWFDLDKAPSFPHLYNWYMRKASKKALPLDTLLQTIIIARRTVLSAKFIQMKRLSSRKKKGDIDICPECGEAYPTSHGARCKGCGEGYYDWGWDRSATAREEASCGQIQIVAA